MAGKRNWAGYSRPADGVRSGGSTGRANEPTGTHRDRRSCGRAETNERADDRGRSDATRTRAHQHRCLQQRRRAKRHTAVRQR